VMRAKAGYGMKYASSVLIVGGKLKGFLRKSERLSCERSKSCCVGLGFYDFSYFFFLVAPFSVFSTDFLDLASSLLPFLDFGGFYVFYSLPFDLLFDFFSLIIQTNLIND
jgi:hypothetical protein